MMGERNTVLIVGATGSLGKPLVAEFQARGIPLRLVGRSEESFTQAGYEQPSQTSERLELVVCRDVTDRTAWSDTWFRDVRLVVCVARPRGLKAGDLMQYAATIDNLCDAVCINNVPRLILLGLPYFEGSPPFGLSSSMTVIARAEEHARERFQRSDCSSQLTISRINEMSEMGHLLEIARTLHFWPRVFGRDTKLQPVSARDFALAVATFSEQDHYDNKPELLIGGPQVVTWSELGNSISKAIGKRLVVVPLPLMILQVWIGFIRLAKWLVPFLQVFESILQIATIPMILNTTSNEFESIGSDRLDDYLVDRARAGEGEDWLHKRIRLSRERRKSVGTVRTNMKE